MFSDESSFCLGSCKLRSWAKIGDPNEVEQPEHYKTKVMVWGGISMEYGKSELVFLPAGQKFTGEFYKNEVLAKTGVDMCGPRKATLVQDGAKVHTCHLCTEFVEANHIKWET